MKKTITAIAIFLGVWVLFYLIGSFIALDFNMMHWGYPGRFVFSIGSFGIGIMLAIGYMHDYI